jgi:hypothetical protein
LEGVYLGCADAWLFLVLFNLALEHHLHQPSLPKHQDHLARRAETIANAVYRALST